MTIKTNNLVERLLRKEPCFPVHLGKFDGHGQTTITQQVTTDGLRLVNPDGPDAADALQSLSARIAVLREALESIARYDVGLQGLVEDGTDTPENVAKYYAGQVERRRKIARIALTKEGTT